MYGDLACFILGSFYGLLAAIAKAALIFNDSSPLCCGWISNTRTTLARFINSNSVFGYLVNSRFACLTTFVIACYPCNAISSDKTVGPPTEAREEAQVTLSGLLSSREAIWSGSYRAVVVTSVGDDDPNPNRYDLFSAWDDAKGVSRFDYLYIKGNVSGKFITGPEASWFTAGLGSVHRYASTWRPDAFLFRPFDIRIVGMSTFGFFQRRMSWKALNEYYGTVCKIGGFEHEDGGVRSLTLRHHNKVDMEYLVSIDVARGFVPTSLVWSYTDPSTKLPSTMSESAKTSWIKIGDVFVPERAEWTLASTDGKKAKIAIEFAWLSVNSGAPQEYFDHKDLDTGNEAYILDHTLDEQKPIVVGKIRPDASIEEGTRKGARWTRFGLLFFANAIAFGLLAAFLLYRRWKQRNAESTVD